MSQTLNKRLVHALRWALESSTDPSMAAADWLVRDINPRHVSAVEFLTDSEVSTAELTDAKDVFKTMRILGETSSDRRLGARMYAAAIASGLVHHQAKISRQSNAAIERALKGLADDRSLPESLRSLGSAALNILILHRG